MTREALMCNNLGSGSSVRRVVHLIRDSEPGFEEGSNEQQALRLKG